MPQRDRSLTESDVARSVSASFAATEHARFGAEVEFLTSRIDDPLGVVPLQQLSAIAASVPAVGRVSFEPGGQLEISSAPTASLDACIAQLSGDIALLTESYREAGIALRGVGLDPIRPPHRVVRAPRYDAMATYFDQDGGAGLTMMTRTASIQVNLDLGHDPAERWVRAHRLGPTLAAMFTNSPFYCGAATGWRSNRLWNWFAMDPTRTAPADDWTEYLLDARVMLVRSSDERFRPMLRPLSFRGWMQQPEPEGWPDPDDLAYHATTLFPPIRPRDGRVELRATDALGDPWWVVPIVVWSLLLYGDAIEIAEPDPKAWLTAARDGLGDPATASVAGELMSAVLRDLPQFSSDPRVREVVTAFAEHWTFAGRSPADDAIDAGGSVELERSAAMKASWI